ncbi:hypothetical protein F4861DRAFT_542666 [Xylaria intraflava]|nr:hypothetical protein F4861DRAFT_542666 [Xylaria intraflava]
MLCTFVRALWLFKAAPPFSIKVPGDLVRFGKVGYLGQPPGGVLGGLRHRQHVDVGGGDWQRFSVTNPHTGAEPTAHVLPDGAEAIHAGDRPGHGQAGLQLAPEEAVRVVGAYPTTLLGWMPTPLLPPRAKPLDGHSGQIFSRADASYWPSRPDCEKAEHLGPLHPPDLHQQHPPRLRHSDVRAGAKANISPPRKTAGVNRADPVFWQLLAQTLLRLCLLVPAVRGRRQKLTVANYPVFIFVVAVAFASELVAVVVHAALCGGRGLLVCLLLGWVAALMAAGAAAQLAVAADG